MAVSTEREPVSPSKEIPVSHVTQIPEKIKVRKEVESWLEKVEKASTTLPKTVTDDQTGQPLVQSTNSQTPKITLPLTRNQILKGAKQKVGSAFRWLAEFCLRLIKIKKGQVKFKKPSSSDKK